MDINDSAGIQALLEQLKSSQAWKDAVASSDTINENESFQQHNVDDASQPNPPTPSVSVATLLSQLQAEPYSDATTSQDHTFDSFLPLSPPHPATPGQRADDSRYLTFHQALPVIAGLSEDPRFSKTLKSMKDEQNALETRLWEERKAILAKYEEKIKVAKTKATMIGSGISKHEAKMLSDAFEKELKRFDMERVLPAWDGLVLQQQEALAQMGVPTMFSTTDPSLREKQQKMIQVLDGLIS
ncbi:hypothetical protein BT96DRAFT_141127 [Gymnopus androsaceus JB14]|uniref:Uncharacterized protein n=1 Tax=Gymnopus androsaceus JB14 TaxID=1447944 RepID=A0A6A4HCZ9_9AGAR|nr:hypothetical protein BT96DRAFT_141127 [Gymnopus androsaceus JB14]